jgi:lipoprotein-releasing system permease protein
MTGFPFYIARRYLLSRKSTNVINLISGISVFGVTTGTMALVIILSVFNGLDTLIRSLFSTFDPDLKIELNEGKRFSLDSEMLSQIRQINEVMYVTEVLQENALVRYDDREMVVSVKGVGSEFASMSGIDTMLFDGRFVLEENGRPLAVVGYGIASQLSVGLAFIDPLIFYAPRHDASINDPEKAVTREVAFPSGIFSVQQEIDHSVILVPLTFARDLFNEEKRISALEVKLRPGASESKVREEISHIIGDDFECRNRYQQQELLYKTIRSEKLIGFIILGFILLIASFNVIGSLTMLIIEKREDIRTLQHLGATLGEIRKIFMFEGWAVSLLGSLAGILLGVLFSVLQDKIGIIPLQGDGSFIVDYYPVLVLWEDLLAVFITVSAIGLIAAWYPVRRITVNYF